MPIMVQIPRHEYGNYYLKLTVMAKYSGKGRAECSVWDCYIRRLVLAD